LSYVPPPDPRPRWRRSRPPTCMGSSTDSQHLAPSVTTSWRRARAHPASDPTANSTMMTCPQSSPCGRSWRPFLARSPRRARSSESADNWQKTPTSSSTPRSPPRTDVPQPSGLDVPKVLCGDHFGEAFGWAPLDDRARHRRSADRHCRFGADIAMMLQCAGRRMR